MGRLKYMVVYELDKDFLVDEETLKTDFNNDWQQYLNWLWENEPSEVQLGFELMPGVNNKSEPSNMPWSTRWYRPDTVVYTDGTKGSLHMTVDIAEYLYQNVTVKLVTEPNSRDKRRKSNEEHRQGY